MKPGQKITIDVDKLTADPRNARVHDERNIESIATSLKEFGQQKPIVVMPNGQVVAGNGTLEAARKLGWSSIECWVTELDESKAKAFAIADNRTAELASWDNEILVDTLMELQSMDDIDLGSTGFTDDDIDALRPASTQDVVEDEVPEPPSDPVTKPGDVWQLGRHRLMCGDSTSSSDVAILLDGVSPFIMVTDPPYGVGYDPKWRDRAGNAGMIRWVNNTGREGKVENDDQENWSESFKLFDGDVAYVWHASWFIGKVQIDLSESSLNTRSLLIWKKPSFAISRGHYHWQHEPCWYAVRQGTTAKWKGDRSQSTIWDISNRLPKNDSTNHGTQKPVECMARPIRNHGDKTDDVYDPFLGSGTTLIAAEQLDRTCYGIEISPAYCDVILERWQNLTGEKATRC